MNAISTIRAKRRIELNELLNNSRNKSIFVSAVTILLLIVLIIFGIIPSMRSVISQYKENQLIQKTIDEANKKIAAIKDMVDEKENKSQVLGVFDTVMPMEIIQGETIEQLYDFAGGDVYITAISFPEEYPTQSTSLLGVTEKVKDVEVTIRADGTEKSLREFVRKIEESSKVFNIINLSFNRKSDDEIETLGIEKEFEINLTLEYYYWAEVISL
ncbi:hypothetical protein KC669_00340 [Candidatus Dojkabacteria bacterium]|uniref:Uncharacterized protein n=1 Tax=Candidatus Dojkabacteria bacterium TaxID=2099670 RepID=A0A955L983_9BACT|nr:hypothetical protein [Candidatus Dojkabacteria bacterium]